MIKLASRGAAVVLVGSALALAGGLVPAQAATSGWRTDATVAVRGSVTLFTSVAASSPSDAWASGFSLKAKGTVTVLGPTVIRHWTGKTWRPVKLPAKIARASANEALAVGEVGVSSARNVWVFGVLGSYLRLDGTKWRLGQLPGISATSAALVQINAVKVFSGTDAWAFGERDTVSGAQELSAPYAAHYNGRKWSMLTVPVLPSGAGAITAVAAVSSHDIWAVEGAPSSSVSSAAASPAIARAVAASPAARSVAARLRAAGSTATAPVILQWTSKAGWHDAAQQPSKITASDELVSGVAEPGGHVWFGGSAKNSANGTSPLTAEWNGTSWSVKDLPSKPSSADLLLGAMAPDGSGGIWALVANNTSGVERIWHLHGTIWSEAKPAFGKHTWALDALARVPRTRSVWGVGTEIVGKSSANGLIAVDGTLPR